MFRKVARSSFFWNSVKTIPINLRQWSSWRRCSTRIFMSMERFALIFFKISGLQYTTLRLCSRQFNLCWVILILRHRQTPRRRSCTRETGGSITGRSKKLLRIVGSMKTRSSAMWHVLLVSTWCAEVCCCCTLSHWNFLFLCQQIFISKVSSLLCLGVAWSQALWIKYYFARVMPLYSIFNTLNYSFSVGR